MSLSITLLNALSGMTTNQTALSVTSSNIANVNTPEYSRKVHEQQNRVIGGVGAGVETAQITRKIDEFLQKDFFKEITVLAKADVRNEFFARTQELFGSPGNNNALGNVITDLATALEDVASSPELAANRFTAVAEANQFAIRMRDMADQIQTLRSQADREIAAGVDDINEELANIASLNVEISQNNAKGLPTGDLEDSRDRSIKIISDYLDVTKITSSDGQISLMTEDGRMLVGGSTASTLSYTPSSTMTASQSYPATISGIYVNGGASPPASADITGCSHQRPPGRIGRDA